MTTNNNKQIISPQEFLKILQILQNEEQQLNLYGGGNLSRNKKILSIEDYTKQAVENMLDKLGIVHSHEED